MPQRWAIRLAVEGDLRFASHHEMMRVIERAAIRAAVGVKFTEGFNPHPVLSLPSPRPVGIATTCDLLVLSLTDESDAQLDEPELLRRLNRQAPIGLRFNQAGRVSTSMDLRPRRIVYELPLNAGLAPAVQQRIDELDNQDEWIVQRRAKSKRRSQQPRYREVDLKCLCERLAVSQDAVEMVLVPADDRWAKPAELLELLGLDPRVDLARMTRTALDNDLPAPFGVCSADSA